MRLHPELVEHGIHAAVVAGDVAQVSAAAARALAGGVEGGAAALGAAALCVLRPACRAPPPCTTPRSKARILEWLGLLLEHGLSAQPPVNWKTADASPRVLVYLLGNALTRNQLLRAQLLLDHGAYPNALHFYQRRPVHEVALLLGPPGPVRDAERGPTLELLLEHGANPRATKRAGKTAAEVAEERGHDDIAELLWSAQGGG